MAAIEQTETSIPRTDTFSDDLNGTIPGDGNLKAGAEDASIIKVSSCPPSPVPEKTREQIIASRIQFAALCLSLFLLGWNDGSTGPLIPRLREVYNVGFTVVSLVFIATSAGYIPGALLNVWLTDRLGFGKTIALGAVLQIVAYSVQASAPPFAAFVVFNAVNGLGLVLQDAQANGLVGALKEHAETKMGFLHAAYGLGAFVSPFVATQFARMERWSFHYLVSLGLSVLNVISLVVIFRFRGQRECLIQGGETVHDVTKEGKSGTFRQILSNKAVHFMAFFIFVYVGVEVTIGGWIVTYIIDVRDGGPSSGYVSGGFFGGLTLGRVILLPVNKWVGERRALFIYAGLALGLDFVIWFVPSLVGNAITVSLIGVLLGPMFPIAMNQSSRILPPWILTGAIGWIAGFGQAGSAIIPFITGAIAQRHGIKSLHPLLVAMMVLMIFLFWMTPAERPREAEEPMTIEEDPAKEKESSTA